MPKYIQSLTYTRRVDVDPATTKGQVYQDLIKRAAAIEIEGFELDSLEAWKAKVDKNGNEDRDYD